MRYTGQVMPGSTTYSPASVPTQSYRMQAPRMPPPSPYGSHFHDNQLAPKVEYNWNPLFNGDYQDPKLGVGLTEGWYCQMCNVELPNESAWQLVSFHISEVLTVSCLCLHFERNAATALRSSAIVMTCCLSSVTRVCGDKTMQIGSGSFHCKVAKGLNCQHGKFENEIRRGSRRSGAQPSWGGFQLC